MGTDVNPVAWENAEIMAMALVENPKNTQLQDYFLEFISYLTEKHGVGKVSGDNYSIGNSSYLLEIPKTPSVPALTRVLYETFYKHQF